MIVGTAGHIDHGKTTLVRALTGVDTDRLKEEKARGISIELGYAYTPLANGDVLGFIDVPGHEKLVHTMAAGASGIDFGLLVVAADDGVMPQTREHLAILALLGVDRGAVVITKADRADAGRIEAVKDEIRALAAASFLQDAPLFVVAAGQPGDPGVAGLKTWLHAQAQTLAPRPASGLFRLAIDRAFTLAGHGTVVTGTVHDGMVRVGEDGADLRLMPAGRAVRVRSIHAQNRSSDTGAAGQRCALNLPGVDKDDIARGDWVADARCFTPSRHLDVELRWQGDTPLSAWTPLHVHLGAARALAHAVPLAPAELPPDRPGGCSWSSTSRCAPCPATATSSAMPRPTAPWAADRCWTPMRRTASGARPRAWPGWTPSPPICRWLNGDAYCGLPLESGDFSCRHFA